MGHAVVTLNGKDIDLARALPLQLKDWRTLKKHGVTPESLQKSNADADQVHILVHHILAKANPAVTEADVDELHYRHPVMVAVMEALREGETSDRPS